MCVYVCVLERERERNGWGGESGRGLREGEKAEEGDRMWLSTSKADNTEHPFVFFFNFFVFWKFRIYNWF